MRTKNCRSQKSSLSLLGMIILWWYFIRFMRNSERILTLELRFKIEIWRAVWRIWCIYIYIYIYVCIIPFYVLLCIKTRIKISFVYTTVNYLKFNNKYTNHRGQLFTAMLINIDLLIQELSFTIVIMLFLSCYY